LLQYKEQLAPLRLRRGHTTAKRLVCNICLERKCTSENEIWSRCLGQLDAFRTAIIHDDKVEELRETGIAHIWPPCIVQLRSLSKTYFVKLLEG
jgi:hypothetical protein